MKGIKTILILFTLILVFISCKKEKEPYNVLFIAVDDLNDWVGFLGGHPQTITPNMDKLASTGVIFENAYCAASVCNPSRAALMTGMRPASSGIYQNNHFMRSSELLKDALTIPQYFSQYGYFTTARGKIFHHPNGKWADEGSWDEHVKQIGNGMNQHPDRNDSVLACGMPYSKSSQYNFDWGGLKNLDVEETSDRMNARWAVEQLNKDYDKPFFIACGLFRPHLPWYVPQEYFDKFPADQIELPIINENDLDDVPEIGRMMSSGLEYDSDFQRVKRYGLQKEAVQAYLACINYTDDNIGVLLDGLEKSKYRDNTIIVFWADHGWHLGEKLHYRKYNLWEESCRMPLVISVPDVTKPGARCNRTVNLLDLYPTLVELCGLPKKEDIQGNSIVDLLKNPMLEWDHPSLTTMGRNRHSIRSEQYRYIQYEDGSNELYDHYTDSLEWTNLAGKEEYQEIINDFKKLLPKDNVDEVDVTSKH